MKEVTSKVGKKFNEFIEEGKEDLKKIKRPRDIVKQIPNLFTLSRLFLIPFIVANIISGNLLTAGFISLGASVTDLIDGKVARALNATSNFGANLDALIDKVFVTSITIPLFFTNPYLLLPIFLDMTIASINGYAHIQGVQTKTSKIGKVKTVFLDSLICSSFFTNFKVIDSISKGLYLATVAFQMKTAKEYYNTYLANNSKTNNHLIKLEESIDTKNDQSRSLDIGLENQISKDINKNDDLENLVELKNIIVHYKELDEKQKTEENLFEEGQINITKK